jgi:hypothetical protein
MEITSSHTAKCRLDFAIVNGRFGKNNLFMAKIRKNNRKNQSIRNFPAQMAAGDADAMRFNIGIPPTVSGLTVNVDAVESHTGGRDARAPGIGSISGQVLPIANRVRD